MAEKKQRYYVLIFLLFVYLVLMFIFFLYPSYKDKHNKTSIIVDKDAKWYYEDSKWKDMTSTNQYNWQKFDIYQDGSYFGNYSLLYNDKWYAFGDNRTPITMDGTEIFAIKTNQKYKYGSFILEDISEADEKYVRKVLEDNDITALTFTTLKEVNFDLDSDGEDEKLFVVSNIFTDETVRDIFNFIFTVKNGKITIIKKDINTYDNMYRMCKAYLSHLVDITGDGNYEIITGCGYYSDKKQCIEMYQKKRNKYVKVKSCEEN